MKDNKELNEKFIKYSGDIELSTVYCNRVEEIYNFYKEICPETIQDIFITEYINEDQSREYENLWFFSENYIMEAKKFISQDNFDMTVFSNIIRWEMQKKDYNFNKAVIQSRINAKFEDSNSIPSYFKASGENCDYFKEMFMKYILPKIKMEE